MLPLTYRASMLWKMLCSLRSALTWIPAHEGGDTKLAQALTLPDREWPREVTRQTRNGSRLSNTKPGRQSTDQPWRLPDPALHSGQRPSRVLSLFQHKKSLLLPTAF